LPAEKIKATVEATLHTSPPDATHLSTRAMAQATGVSNAAVARVWGAHGLQPYRVEGFKRSKDSRFVEKLTDVVGIPRARPASYAWMKNCKYRCWDRTQLGLPMKKGRC